MGVDQKVNISSTVQCPEWLNQNLFEPVLKANIPHYKKITSLSARGALPPGENYTTQVLRIEIEVELDDGHKKVLSYILKIANDSEQFKKIMAEMQTFKRETGVFMDIVPELEQMYKDAGLNVKFSANAFHLDAPEDCLLLEDLCVRGFKNVDRLECLDMEHMKSVLKKLAQWHAATAVRVERKGKYDDFYALGPFKEESKEILQNVYTITGTSLINALPKFKGSELWKDSVELYQKNVTDELFKSAKVDPNEFNVLNLGDVWSNNIMFQYDDFGKIKETYFVDLQMPKYGTPAQDLIYFIFSSAKLDVKLNNFDYFIKYYHDNLIEHLTLLKYPKHPPSLKELHILLHKHGVWGYFTVLLVMAAVLMDRVQNANLDNFIGESAEGDAFKKFMYTNDRYRQHAEAILSWLFYRGTFDNA